MNISIQHFLEKGIKKLEQYEKKFLNNPTDIASFVFGITDELHKLGLEIIKENFEFIDSEIQKDSKRKENWSVERHDINRNKYYNKACRFLKAKKSKKIIEGTNEGHPDRIAKFNQKTLEYLVYEKETKKIISYYLPKHKQYKNYGWTFRKWTYEAKAYAIRHIVGR